VGELKSVIESLDDIIGVFETDGKADEVLAEATGELSFFAELRVRGGSRVKDQALSVANVSEVREELNVVDHLDSGVVTALDTEDNHATEAILEVLGSDFVGRIALEAWVADPSDVWMVREEFGYLESVFGVLSGAERQGFDALQEDPSSVRSKGGTEVTEKDGAEAEDVGEGLEFAEVVSEAEAVVSVIGFVVESELRIGPVEVTAVNDDTTDGSTVSADPLRKGVNDDVSAVVDGAEEGRRREGGVNDERQVVLLSDGGVFFDVSDVENRVADRFNVDRTGLVIDSSFNSGKVVQLGEASGDAVVRKDGIKHGVGATVKVVSSNKFVASLKDVDDSVVNSSRTRGNADGANATFEGSDTLFQHIVGWVHQAGIDVAEFLETEEVSTVLGVLEDVSRRAVDRYATCKLIRIDCLASVDGKCFWMVISVAHE
jgi:hypothetical protein